MGPAAPNNPLSTAHKDGGSGSGSGGGAGEGLGAGSHAGAESLDDVTAEELEAINADPKCSSLSTLPVVSKERPNLPKVFSDVGTKLKAKAEADSQLVSAGLTVVAGTNKAPALPVEVAVVVCGPQEMVVQAHDVATEWNAGPGGRFVIFHVHHETFLF